MHRFASLLVIAALAACGGPQKRPDALEQRLASVETEVAKLRAEIAERDRDRLEAEASSTRSFEEKLSELDQRIKEVDLKTVRPVRPPRPQLDPTKVYAVPVGTSPVVGPATAKVTIVFAGEYACPFCHKVRATLADLRAKYGKDLRLVHKSFIVHPQVATSPALAACAAHRQGRWQDMDDALWTRVFEARQFEEDLLFVIAADVGLDMKRFKADLRGQVCQDDVNDDQTLLTTLGVGATPAFFINGRFLSGAQPQPAFEAIIDEEMAKATEAIKNGVKAKDYYDTIVKSGLTKPEP